MKPIFQWMEAGKRRKVYWSEEEDLFRRMYSRGVMPVMSRKATRKVERDENPDSIPIASSVFCGSQVYPLPVSTSAFATVADRLRCTWFSTFNPT